MAGSKTAPRKRLWRPLYLIPILIVVIVSIAFIVVLTPPTRAAPVLNYSLNLSIAVSDNSTGTPRIRYLTPPPYGIGIPGGVWVANTYDAYGVGGTYPLFTVRPPQTSYPGYFPIYVRSTINRTYTLGDFFAVWGEPLGMKNTLGLTSPPASNSTSFGPGWFWDMCVGPNSNSLHEGQWGSEALTPGKAIILLYSDLGCVNSLS